MKILIISSAAIPAPIIDLFRIDYKPLLSSIINLVKKLCVICKLEFESKGRGICCDKSCQKVKDYRVKKAWDEKNKEHVETYSKNYHPLNAKFRKERRKRIYDLWGRNGRKDWKLAEKLAGIILAKNEGFHSVIHLSKLDMLAMYDIFALKYEKIYFFQVTTRTHTEKKKQHKKALEAKAIHQVFFISLKLQKYLIKDFAPNGFCELSETDIANSKDFPPLVRMIEN